MTPSFNQLTPAEAERLAMLAEEAGEIVQAVGKVLRHGYESRPPAGGRTNGEQLYRELGDLIAVVHGMMWAGDIVEIVELTDAAGRWEAKLRYAHHQDGAEDNVAARSIISIDTDGNITGFSAAGERTLAQAPLEGGQP